MNVEFLPIDGHSRNISSQLSRSLDSCKSLRGSIAFWTLDVEALDGSLLRALLRPASEIYVDMQWPTDYGKLTRLYEEILQERTPVPLFICLRKNGFFGNGESVSLLHTKLLLFDMGGGEFEIWVGSHNFTRMALEGSNLEASVRIEGHKDEPQFSQLLLQVSTYLNQIRNFCQPFDPDKAAMYESLRGRLTDKELLSNLRESLSDLVFVEELLVSRVLSLQSTDADKLTGQTIILLGNLSEELAYIRHRNRGGSPVILRIRDSTTNQEFTYKANLRAFDTIDNVSSINVAFNARRWAERKAAYKGEEVIPPVLKPLRDVGSDLIESNKYYINVDIINLIHNRFIGYYTYPETNPSRLWHSQPETFLNYQFDSSSFGLLPRHHNSSPTHLVPVENAEEMVSIRPVEWKTGFVDGLLERRIIVLGARINSSEF